MSVIDIIRDLENIINNPKKDWKNIELLIDFYKKKLEEQSKFGLQLMAIMIKHDPSTGKFTPSPPLSALRKVEEFNKEQMEAIHCILTDGDVDVETCKKCDNQCVNYLTKK